MKQGVIFDMDGVIIDSESIHKKCEREIFRMLGITVSESDHNVFIGSTDETMWSQIARIYNLPINIPEIIQIKKSLYMELLKHEVSIKPIPYVLELIIDLYKNKFSVALASSSPYEQVDYILSAFELKRYFHSIISGDDVENGKPNPEIFLKAAESVGVEPKSCAVIEDSFNGVMAAKNAGMKCIGYLNPNSGNQDLSKSDMIIHSFNEISIMSIKDLL